MTPESVAEHFGSGAVTTFYNDWGLWWPNLDLPNEMWTASQLGQICPLGGNLSVFHQWKYSACPNEKNVGNYSKNG